MKIISKVGVIFLLILSCSKRKEVSLHESVENFKISECKTACGIDSVGIRLNKVKHGDLFVRLGYIVNCSWEGGYLKNIINKNDTLLIELDRPHDIDTLKIDSLKTDVIEYHVSTSYPSADCDCFFYFDFTLKNFNTIPKSIRIAELFEENKYWDERLPSTYEIEEVEDVEIEIE